MKDSGNVVNRAHGINFVFKIGNVRVAASVELVESRDLRNWEMSLR
jgi:hypothetical protein